MSSVYIQHSAVKLQLLDAICRFPSISTLNYPLVWCLCGACVVLVWCLCGAYVPLTIYLYVVAHLLNTVVTKV